LPVVERCMRDSSRERVGTRRYFSLFLNPDSERAYRKMGVQSPQDSSL